MAGNVLDTSVLIGLIAGEPNEILDKALGDAQDIPVYEVDLGHWINVGFLRQHLRRHGLTVTLPDAHIAQCAIERDAALITRDAVFVKIAQHANLRVITA